MLELLAPAGSPEGIVAAVQNGADAVYLGFGNFNARRNAKNFSEEDFKKAAEYCRVRGVKVYVTLNTLAADRELPDIAKQAQIACRLGADAILVQDIGVLKAIKQAAPEIQLHASTQMSLHNLEGVKLAAAMGLSRVVLSRELSRDQIAKICDNSPVEIEIFGHGALCMCYSGQCYMSAIIGRRSGNRGLCAQPCRMQYSIPGARKNGYPLSLKDNCLVESLRDIERIGVKCIKLEGRMKRPEYAAVVSGIYSRAIRSGKKPSDGEMQMLHDAFNRDGFTNGYFTGKKGASMFGVRNENEKPAESLFASAKRVYLKNEFQRVPVKYAGKVLSGVPSQIAVQDDLGNIAVADGPVPEHAFHKELTKTSLQTQLFKTGGTPFICEGVKSEVDGGLSLPVSAINEMRRQVLSELMEKRRFLAPRKEGEFIPGFKLINREDKPVTNISILKLSQLSRKLLELAPDTLYIPLEEFNPKDRQLSEFLSSPDINVAAIIPRIIHDNELQDVGKMLLAAKSAGVTDVLVGNLGHIIMCSSMGFNVRGDFGLNVYNSQTLKIFKEFGLVSATLSFEMRLEQIRSISKPIDTELVVYGRLPLMITENCIIKSSSGVCGCNSSIALTDRNGFNFPIVKSYGCRSTLLNSQKLFLGDKQRDYEKLGLWAARLSFTTENAAECAAVAERYMGQGDYAPADFTRGLYYRGVE